jgi:FKBP-type peptidyl-prolyl cis-trans isomerase SlyD
MNQGPHSTIFHSKTMNARVISFHYTLKDDSGQTLDSSEGNQPLSFLTGVGQIIPGLEKEIQAMKVGEKKNVKVAAENAYGKMDPKKLFDVPLENLPKKDLQVGDQFRSNQPDSPVMTVTKLSATHATLDGNHPLAGLNLTFDVEITEIRDATEDEKAHGHAHGPGGHHHH